MELKDKILDSITKEDVVDIMTSFNVPYEISENGDLIFASHCHGSEKKKLYYYETDADGNSSKHFMCYSACGGLSIFDVLMRINDWGYSKAFSYLASYKGISAVEKKEKVFGAQKKVIKDWDFINKYKRLDKSREKKGLRQLPEINPSIMNFFENVYPSSWIEDGITLEAMKKFNIRFYMSGWKAVIPHFDLWGRLIGIRGRAFLEKDIDAGKKYMPIYLEGESYRHPLDLNLYGLFENKEIIKRLKKVIVFEGEKSVLQCESFYPNNNFSVALCGTNLSNYKRDLLIHELEVEEVIIALDKQYKTELIAQEDIDEYDRYIKKVQKIADKFVNYASVNIVYCDDDRLNYKDAPSDKGKNVLEQLMREKERYYKTYE